MSDRQDSDKRRKHMAHMDDKRAMSDDLIIRLKDGVVEREKRWQGDTHDDLGGWVDYDATDKLMAEAAAELTRLRARIEAADKLAALTARISVGLHQTAKGRDLSEGELAFMREADAALYAYEGAKG